MTAQSSDEALMLAVAEGDGKALRYLMDRYMGRSIKLAERVGAWDGEEVAQEAFVRVWKHADRFDARRAKFTTWLYRIVVNLALDRPRRKHASIDDVPEVASREPGAEENMLAAQRQRLADMALATLPERQRAAIALFYLDGLSGREAATVLEVSEKAFESLLSRGKAACRAFIAAAQQGERT